MFVTKNSKKPDPVFQIDHRIDVEIVIDNNKRVQMFSRCLCRGFRVFQSVLICGAIMIVTVGNNGSGKLAKGSEDQSRDEISFGSTEQRTE